MARCTRVASNASFIFAAKLGLETASLVPSPFSDTVSSCLKGKPAPLPPRADGKNILLFHHPLLAERVTHKFDLLLAGHSHGGQVRIPFYGAIMVPYWVGKYEMGKFRVPAGPLYVNPGIGSPPPSASTAALKLQSLRSEQRTEEFNRRKTERTEQESVFLRVPNSPPGSFRCAER